MYVLLVQAPSQWVYLSKQQTIYPSIQPFSVLHNTYLTPWARHETCTGWQYESCSIRLLLLLRIWWISWPATDVQLVVGLPVFQTVLSSVQSPVIKLCCVSCKGELQVARPTHFVSTTTFPKCIQRSDSHFPTFRHWNEWKPCLTGMKEARRVTVETQTALTIQSLNLI